MSFIGSNVIGSRGVGSAINQPVIPLYARPPEGQLFATVFDQQITIFGERVTVPKA